MICPKCSYYWKARVENPVACPSCKVRIKEFTLQREREAVKSAIQGWTEDLKLNDFVILKSGSPLMTVKAFLKNNTCECTWEGDDKTESAIFYIECLAKVQIKEVLT